MQAQQRVLVLDVGFEQRLDACQALVERLALQGVVTLVGLAYYAVRHRERPSPLLAPGRDDVTDDHRALAGSA